MHFMKGRNTILALKIDGIRLLLFRFPPDMTPPNHRTVRQHFFLKLCSGDKCGWSEFIAPVGQNDVDVITYTKCFGLLRGRTVSEAFAMVRAMLDIWPNALTEAAELALIDLQGKLTKKSAAQLLVLNGRMPVRGVSFLWERRPSELAKQAQALMEHGRVSCIKMTLSGDVDLDRELVRTVRQYAPQEKVFLIGAPHERYASRLYSSCEQIGMQLLMLYAAGLDACEDPARLTYSEWVRLQEYTENFQLIPEAPMRVSRRALRAFRPDMAKMFNIRAGYTGSVFDAVLLGERILAGGGHFLIGDDGFIGPACAQWQQIAVALGADWVECSSRTAGAAFYHRAVRSEGIMFCNGVYNQLPTEGFGIELDEDVLGEQSAFVIDL